MAISVLLITSDLSARSRRGRRPPQKITPVQDQCADERVTKAYQEVLGRLPKGKGKNEGECFYNPSWVPYLHIKRLVASYNGKILGPDGKVLATPAQQKPSAEQKPVEPPKPKLPEITSFDPTEILWSSVFVKGKGKNLENTVSVTVGGRKANFYWSTADTVAFWTKGDIGDGTVVVTTKTGSATASVKLRKKTPGPTITLVHPIPGAFVGETVTVTGTTFVDVESVKFDDIPAHFEVVDGGRLKVVLPNNPGTRKLFVKTAHGLAGYDRYPIKEKPAPPPAEPQKITKNALGNPELCFGAVGKGCGGFGDLKEGEAKGTQPLWLTAGCSPEVRGWRRCWVVPGSIKHDNCCVRHPHGKHCGGPMSDGSNAGEWNHDRNCVQEWDDAVWDVKNGRGWEADLPSSVPADLTPAKSPYGRYKHGEVAASVNLCAADGYSISARHSVAFCCSGSAEKKWALGVEDWLECRPSSGGRNIQMSKKKEEGTPSRLDMTKPPSKPGALKRLPVAMKTQAPREREIKRADMELRRVTPPPPPSEVSKRSPEPTWTPPPPVEEGKISQGPVEQEVARNCPRGTWSPTLRRCIEDEIPEEAAPPPQCERGVWSPTLKMCVE